MFLLKQIQELEKPLLRYLGCYIILDGNIKDGKKEEKRRTRKEIRTKQKHQVCSFSVTHENLHGIYMALVSIYLSTFMVSQYTTSALQAPILAKQSQTFVKHPAWIF